MAKKKAEEKPKKKATPKAPKGEMGAPSKYQEAYAAQVYKLCLLGATDKEIGDFFEVCEATINNWKKEYPEFLESIKKGKIVADANVANALYKKATGFENDEVKIFQYEGAPVVVPYKAYYAPDTAAINIWLKNRRGRVKDTEGQRWADKHEYDHTSAGDKLEAVTIFQLPDNGRETQ
jgi:hypothetical protein